MPIHVMSHPKLFFLGTMYVCDNVMALFFGTKQAGYQGEIIQETKDKYKRRYKIEWRGERNGKNTAIKTRKGRRHKRKKTRKKEERKKEIGSKRTAGRKRERKKEIYNVRPQVHRFRLINFELPHMTSPITRTTVSCVAL